MWVCVCMCLCVCVYAFLCFCVVCMYICVLKSLINACGCACGGPSDSMWREGRRRGERAKTTLGGTNWRQCLIVNGCVVCQ